MLFPQWHKAWGEEHFYVLITFQLPSHLSQPNDDDDSTGRRVIARATNCKYLMVNKSFEDCNREVSGMIFYEWLFCEWEIREQQIKKWVLLESTARRGRFMNCDIHNRRHNCKRWNREQTFRGLPIASISSAFTRGICIDWKWDHSLDYRLQ